MTFQPPVRCRGELLGFLLALASILGGGVFFLPEVVDPLPLGWAIGVILGCGVLFACTTAFFASSLERYLNEVTLDESADFIGSMLTARLGKRPAQIIGFLLLAQAVLFLFGFVHEVAGRTASLINFQALPIALLIAMVVVIQQRSRSTKASIGSALVLAAINAVALLGLLTIVATGVSFTQIEISGASAKSPSLSPIVVATSFSFSLLYGHIGAATAVVAARERSLSARRVRCGLAAGIMSVAVILAATVVLHRSIPVQPGGPSFFLDRLDLLDIPALPIVASVYLVGQLMLQSLHTSLGITMLTRDWLINTRELGKAKYLATAPAATVVVFAGLAAQFDFGGYKTALALSGVLLAPILGGCIPILIRHREGPPQTWLLRPSIIVAIGVSVAFLVPTASHGLVVWPGVLHRSLIVLTLALMAVIMLESLTEPAAGRDRSVKSAVSSSR